MEGETREEAGGRDPAQLSTAKPRQRKRGRKGKHVMDGIGDRADDTSMGDFPTSTLPEGNACTGTSRSWKTRRIGLHDMYVDVRQRLRWMSASWNYMPTLRLILR